MPLVQDLALGVFQLTESTHHSGPASEEDSAEDAHAGTHPYRRAEVVPRTDEGDRDNAGVQQCSEDHTDDSPDESSVPERALGLFLAEIRSALRVHCCDHGTFPSTPTAPSNRDGMRQTRVQSPDGSLYRELMWWASIVAIALIGSGNALGPVLWMGAGVGVFGGAFLGGWAGVMSGLGQLEEAEREILSEQHHRPQITT